MDPSTILVLRDIHVTGNKKTKTYIILRQMLIKEGDTVRFERMREKLEESRSLVYNLNLFSEVNFETLYYDSSSFRLNITVREKWYLYPVPQFQLTDRNFNEWVKEHHADLDRVVYGAKFIHYNLSGRGDQLKIYLLNGYTRNLSFSYSTPYSNPGLTEGFRVSAGFTQEREIPYKTTFNNKQARYKTEGFLRTIVSAGLLYSRKRGYFKRTAYAVGFRYIDVNDSIVTDRYNPSYFNSAKSYQSFITLAYSFQYSKTDNINYPLYGMIYRISLLKQGLQWKGGLNMFAVDAGWSRYGTLSRRWKLFYGIENYGKLKLPFDQPYINSRSLGYDLTYLRGLEYYVVDGVAALLGKYTVRKKLISFRINLPFNIRQLPYIPFTFYGKAYSDLGYSYIKPKYETNLNNRFLYTYGFGIDLISLYDATLNLEYSFNQLGENGLFLHVRGGF